MNHGALHGQNIQNPFDYFDAIYCINLDDRLDRWTSVQEEFRKMNILKRVVRFSAIRTPQNGHLGCMLSHCAIVNQAQADGLDNVLVFEDDITFSSSLDEIGKYFSLIQQYNWDLLYLSGQFPFGEIPLLKHLGSGIYRGIGIKGTHAIAYRSSVFNTITKIHTSRKSAENFIKKHTAIDCYFSRFLQPNIQAIIYQKPLLINTPNKSDIQGTYSDMNHLIIDNFYFWKVLHSFKVLRSLIILCRPTVVFFIDMIFRKRK